jgi:predicted PurR-regulated permease PerM
MGNAVDLPPLIVLIGVIAGAEAFGIMGALLATPMIATGKLIFRYIYGKIMVDALVAPSVGSKPNQ